MLKILVEAIENFNEEQAVNIISNTFTENSAINLYCNINPVEAIVLHNEKIALYEHMLKEKDEMMNRLEKLIQSK